MKAPPSEKEFQERKKKLLQNANTWNWEKKHTHTQTNNRGLKKEKGRGLRQVKLTRF